MHRGGLELVQAPRRRGEQGILPEGVREVRDLCCQEDDAEGRQRCIHGLSDNGDPLTGQPDAGEGAHGGEIFWSEQRLRFLERRVGDLRQPERERAAQLLRGGHLCDRARSRAAQRVRQGVGQGRGGQSKADAEKKEDSQRGPHVPGSNASSS